MKTPQPASEIRLGYVIIIVTIYCIVFLGLPAASLAWNHVYAGRGSGKPYLANVKYCLCNALFLRNYL